MHEARSPRAERGRKDSEKTLYVLGWLFLAGVLLFLAAAAWLPGFAGMVFAPCIFHSLTGLYCPGCGGSRALTALVHMDVLKSVIYHPFVLYGGGLYTVFMVTHTVKWLSHGKIKGLKYRDRYVYFGVALVIGNWILKNLLLVIWNIELLK